MKIFIDIGHPAHVHYFKNFIKIMKNKGHSFFITARNKEMTHYLLDNLNINYTNRGKGKNGILGKIFYMLCADIKLFKYAKDFKPDMFLSFGSPYAAQVSSLMRKPHIVFDDTENAKLGQFFYKPFSNSIVSPTTFKPDFGKKHIKYNGYIELCYLHPNYFVPDISVLERNNISIDKNFVIIRYVAWNANHDIGHNGISIENKVKAIQEFSKNTNVYITSEKKLPPELESYRLDIRKEDIHHILYYASLFYGESATMASESAILGTPAIYLDNIGRGYTTEQEMKYGSVYNFTESEIDQLKSIEKGSEILKQDKYIYTLKRKKILSDKIDVTSFMIWLVENYPQSAKIMRDTPEYQNNFK